jgi:hypothetical protein
VRDRPAAAQGGARLAPCAGRPCGGRWPPRQRRLCDRPLGPRRPTPRGATLGPPRRGRPRGPASSWATAPRPVRTRPASQPPRRASPAPAWLPLGPRAVPRPRARLRVCHRAPAGPCAPPLRLHNKAGSSARPPGRREPAPAARASGALALAALASQARRGAILGLAADATSLWRLAVPRAGWGRTAPRARLPRRPLRQRHRTRAEARPRQPWWRDRAWSRLTRGVVRRVRGAVPEGTAPGCDTIGPHGEAQERRPSRPPGLAPWRHTDHAVVRGVERRGSQRAPKRATTLAHEQGQWRVHGVPAPWGPPLHPMAGFWRVRQEASGAGRCFPTWPALSPRTRQGLMAHPEPPIAAFPW